MYLRIADHLSLPLDAATQTFAFIGRKGSGKSFGAGKLVELLIGAGVQVVILDVVGNWYGLRLGCDGKASGLDVPIIGGLRGDIPLEPAGGALIADALVESGRSMVLDASQFSKIDRQRFAAAMGERLWRRKKGERQPAPLHLVIEESQLIVPEMVRGDQAVMVGVDEEIIRLGRNYGIGVAMISQRPQSISKEVLNQTECLFVFQVNGAHERDALKKWIVHQGASVDLLQELPGLAVGECYVWSPQWLRTFKRVKVLPKETFDSTSTPIAGRSTFRGRDLKPLDLSDLQTRMAQTIERAKADDPKELKKKVAELEKQLKSKPTAVAQEPPDIVEVPVLKDKQLTLMQKLLERIEKLREKQSEDVKALVHEAESLRQSLQKMSKAPPRLPPPTQPRLEASRRQFVLPSEPATNGKLPVGELAILTALIQFPNGLERRQLSVLTGYAKSSRDAYLSRLQAKGYCTPVGHGRVAATPAGIAALPSIEPLPTGVDLQNWWLPRLPEGERKILEVLLAEHPHSIDRVSLDEITGYAKSSRDAYLSRLAAKQLVVATAPGEVAASPDLF